MTRTNFRIYSSEKEWYKYQTNEECHGQIFDFSDIFQYSSHSGQRWKIGEMCIYLLSRNHLAMGLAGWQVACCTNIWFLHLLDLGFVSFHHAVAGEYDLVTMLISPILYRFVTLFLKEMLHSNLDNVSEIRWNVLFHGSF